MKLSYVLILSLCLPLFTSVQETTAAGVLPTRIMPMGDSITRGSSVPGGYRNKLYQSLTTAGYNVDFIGTATDNGVASLPDSDHEGHGGWRIDELDSNVLNWFTIVGSPDVILLHIGTNDFGQDFDTTNAIHRLDALIEKMATAETNTHIIVSNLMERNDPQNTKIQAEFNPFVEGVVDAHAALGRKVTFLDMRSAVPLSDMPDNLHPNQTGYDKMADAWLPAIQAVVQPVQDTIPPVLVSAIGNIERTQVAITFDMPVADNATNLVNYSISGGLNVTNAQLDASLQIVTLGTTRQSAGTNYTITVNNVTDRNQPTPNVIATNSTIDFRAALARGYHNRIPESDGYTLIYSADLPNAANYSNAGANYTIDAHDQVGEFSRVAYYLELYKPGSALEYVWVSMDAFSSDAAQIGIPTLRSRAVFQEAVSGMNILSNVSGLDTGTNLTGNIEFWPTDYQGNNDTGVPGASNAFDFGDRRSAGGNYGSMQVHHTTAGQTVFSYNRWGGSPRNSDVGIGNRPGTTNTDWTFAENATDYSIKTCRCWYTPPAIPTHPK